MRGYFIAALVFLVGPPALADDRASSDGTFDERRWSSVVEAYGGLNYFQYDYQPSQDFDVRGLAARVNIPVFTNWNIQVDGSFDRIVNGQLRPIDGLTDVRVDTDTYGTASHLYWRDDAFALGGFLSWFRYETYNLGFIEVPNEDSILFPRSFDNDVVEGGLEGQVYLDRFTLYGQVYAGERIRRNVGGPDSATYVQNLGVMGVRGTVRYYPTDMLRLEAELDYHEMEQAEEPLDIYVSKTTRAAAEVTYRFAGLPVASFARYQFEHTFNEGGDIFGNQPPNRHRVVAGLRLSFGSESLIDEDRNGPAMDTVNRIAPSFR